MRNTKITEAERQSDPMLAMSLLQNAKGVKIVIEYLQAMGAPNIKK